MENKPIELVVFDLGRVMIRLAGSWPKACAAAGVPYMASIEDPTIKAKITHLFFLNEIGEMSHEEWTVAVGLLTERSPEQISRVLHAWLDGPFEGWDLLIDELHAAGYKTGCLSNTNHVHWETMLNGTGPNRLPLDRLHFRFASHLIKAHKPDPKIYEYVEVQTGIEPSRILFFDDLEPNIVGARQRGWKAERIVPEIEPVEQVRRTIRQYQTA